MHQRQAGRAEKVEKGLTISEHITVTKRRDKEKGEAEPSRIKKQATFYNGNLVALRF